MPAPETLQVSAESKALALQSHLIRTRDRIAAWEQRLATTEPTPAERNLIADDLQLLTRQLSEPTTKRLLRLRPPAKPEANPLTALVVSLKAQVEALQAKMTHEPVSEPQAAAQS